MSKPTAYQRKDPNRLRRIARLRQHVLANPDHDHRTGELRRLYEEWGFGPQRSTPRSDARTLEAQGILIARGPVQDRHYRVNRARLVTL